MPQVRTDPARHRARRQVLPIVSAIRRPRQCCGQGSRAAQGWGPQTCIFGARPPDHL